MANAKKKKINNISHNMPFEAKVRASSHGMINEKIALQNYCQTYNLIASPCGLFVNQERP